MLILSSLGAIKGSLNYLKEDRIMELDKEGWYSQDDLIELLNR